MSTHEDNIRAAFIRLRSITDPRGHDLLDALERLTIGYDRGFDEIHALINQPVSLHSVRADRLFRCVDPKHDGYRDLAADIYDLREGK